MVPTSRLLLLASATVLISMSSSSDDSPGRLNAKHLNKIFKRFSAILQRPSNTNIQPYPVATTTELMHSGQYIPNIANIKKDTAEYRRSNDAEQQPSAASVPPPVNVTSRTLVSKPVQLFQEIKVLLDESENDTDTLAKPTPTTAPTLRTYTTSTSTSTTTSPLMQTSFPSSFSSTETMVDSFVTRPSDQCKCVCKNAHRLETYDIGLDELRMKLEQAELMHERKTGYKAKIEDVLDGLVDEDENDYDDIDELEQIQKPTKYIPMEIIELSHRRPPTKPTSTTSRIPTGASDHSAAASASFVATVSPATLSTTSTASSTSPGAPLYSVSFTKPAMSTIKHLATRVAQYGIPLLATLALGNALTQIEIDRSSFTDETADPLQHNLTINPFLNYWNLFPIPITPHGYYAPFYESISQRPVTRHADLAPGSKRILQSSSKRRPSKTAKRTTNEDAKSEIQHLLQLIKRWYDKFTS